ncbi:MAG: Thiamine-monophosphate kinase [Candidatus Accumulibacter appositus]|uniref:Thiamine-monophosphate kinase n=1 Tax=Candidatus Accumulibacter appositus TaxID=1454003 RepID=A0A011N7C5_9PROT|nr:thiamine-phosphate kinase [Accumulibacter sp.]EXI78468.1 MAG: Thiamine-monophosphate kinase [Candidatus Accumulibacter appositus]HRF04276.1 thiamine-phosphate kinase [Accumulibacter sp.]
MPSEFDVIRTYFSRPTPQAVLGPGDDCALLVPSAGCELAITTDMLVEGQHFLPDTDPRQLGWKALAVNLSDLAAMGAKPRWALLAGSLPEARAQWLAAFSEGVFACASRYGVDLVGGDTTRGPLNLCFTVLGEVPAGEALRRDRAVRGDDLWISGWPGLAAMGLAHLQGRTRLAETLAKRCLAALQQPRPRVELGLELRVRRLANAAIDVSDGVLADLGHILERSAVAAEIHAAQLPSRPAGVDPLFARQCQLAGGDDYELVFSAAPAKRLELAALAAELDLPLWRFGEVVDAVGDRRLTLLDEDGQELAIDGQGFDHFA